MDPLSAIDIPTLLHETGDVREDQVERVRLPVCRVRKAPRRKC
jgi:hypothetical protein